MDIGDPSCFPLLTRNCSMGIWLVRYRSVRKGLRTRILLEERQQHSGSVTPVSAAAFERFTRGANAIDHGRHRSPGNFLVPGI